MKIFVTGSTGFIGRRLVSALEQRGHFVIRAVRAVPAQAIAERYCRVDFNSDVDMEVWRARLQHIDVVINAVGIIKEKRGQTFAAVHTRAPQALFAAAANAGVSRIIQISALGADAQARSGYHLSKRAADEFLASLDVDSAIVQPSLVYGAGGESAELFTMLASLPIIPVPGSGAYRVQPIHIDDVVAALIALVETPRLQTARVALVGPQAMSFEEFLLRLRSGLGLQPTRTVHVPMFIMQCVARIGEWLPRSLLDRDTLAMLRRGNTADVTATRELLQREPRAVADFIMYSNAERPMAKLRWLLPILRISVALVWLVTGVLSLGIYPKTQSYALLKQAGVPEGFMPLALYAGALLDIALGLSVVVFKKRRLLWLMQVAVILIYTLIITLQLPEFWLHPYGPVLKNIPLLVAIWMLYELEQT